MPAAYDNATGGAPASFGTSHSFSHTCGGSDRVLYAFTFWTSDPRPINAPTYNSVAMTEIFDGFAQATPHNMKLYRLIAPASGSNTFAHSWTQNRFYAAILISVKDADQTTPNGSPVYEGNGDESLAVSSTSDGLVLSFIGESGNTDLTASAPLTERALAQCSTFSRAEGGTAPGDGSSITCTWTSTANTTALLNLCVLAIAGQELTQELTDALSMSDTLSVVLNYAVSLTDALSLTDSLQAPHTDLSPPAEIFSTPEELGEFGDWEDQDLAPSASSPSWTESLLTPVSWTQSSSAVSGTPLTPVECDDTLSNMFCDRDYPEFEAASDCSIFSPVLVAAGGIGRLAHHSVEEVPGDDLLIAVASVGTGAPHTTVATVESASPYTTATKNTLEATNPTITEAIGRINPHTKSFIVAYQFNPTGADRTLRYVSVPWTGSAYNYAGASTYEIDIPDSGAGSDWRALGLVPLKDGRLLSCYGDVTADRMYWNYSEDDGETWSAFESQSFAEGMGTCLVLASDGIPISAHSTDLAGTSTLFARALVDNVWQDAVDFGVTLVGNQAFSLATVQDDRRFAVFYNENGNQLVKVKYCTFDHTGAITVGTTETVVDLGSDTYSGVFATYHAVATAGAKWLAVVVGASGDTVVMKKLDTTGAAWASTSLGTISGPPVFMLPAIPRCAASIPLVNWVSGNTITLRRIAS